MLGKYSRFGFPLRLTISFTTLMFRWQPLSRLEAERLGNRHGSMVLGVRIIALLLAMSTDIRLRFSVFLKKW